VVSSVAVVAEKELVVVVRSSADGAAFALDALPGIFAHGDDHVVGELEASRMTGMRANGTRDQRLGFARFLILAFVA